MQVTLLCIPCSSLSCTKKIDQDKANEALAIVWSGGAITLQCCGWELALATDLQRASGRTEALNSLLRAALQGPATVYVGPIEKIVAHVEFGMCTVKEKLMHLLKASVKQL